MRPNLPSAKLWALRQLRGVANTLWQALRWWDGHTTPPRAWCPPWAPAPLLRRQDRSAPPLGWPRETDSLCPACVQQVRADVEEGRLDREVFRTQRPAEIKAQIVERDGRLVMTKHCPSHGAFEDVLSIDPLFSWRIERLFQGRDYESPPHPRRDHGTSTLKYGRGAVLTIDLTNRCNMRCDPCFVDANQVGHVHELSWEETRKILDESLSVKPRRQMSVQFSGGEPTLSDHFLDAVEYARKLGYFCVQCATNGIRFAQEPEFCERAKHAGLRLVYLQFDGVSNEAHQHRRIANLFEVKQRAIENLHATGIDVVLVVTVVNGLNNDQVGPIVKFAAENADKVTVVSFQPISFTGRDQDIDDDRRRQQRYTLSHLAHDLKAQLGVLEPLRDWFPLSAMNPFSDLVDVLLGPSATWGALKCGCHPDCGIGTVLLVHKHTSQAVPLTRFLDLEQLMQDVQQVADSGHTRPLTLAGLLLAVLRNFNGDEAPEGLSVRRFLYQVLSQVGATGKRVGATEGDSKRFEWRLLFVAGMWFQDLYNYDFRRTEMCIIPYGTTAGEISFCAYNTGIGWRSLVESRERSTRLADWHKLHGRHPIYAKHQVLELPGAPPGPPVHEPTPSGRRRRVRLRLVS